MENNLEHLLHVHTGILQYSRNDSLYTRMAAQPLYKENQTDPELEHKVKKFTDKLSETINIIANEPSLAFFRIQEHVRKTLPQLVDQKHEVEDIQAKVQGACFDAEYATNAVKSMLSSTIHFQNIQDLLKNAMFMKQQISYADKRKLVKHNGSLHSDKSNDRHLTNSSSSNHILNENSTKQPAEDSAFQESLEVEKCMTVEEI